MYPNNIFVYKNGAIRMDDTNFGDHTRFVYEIQKDNDFICCTAYEHPSVNSRFRQIELRRYKLPNLNVWMEE